nr:GGDEF domain-containing protein [Ancylobacter radicis]
MWSFGLLLIVVERLQAKAGALAVVDELTGLPNRRMFLSRIEEETRVARRSGRGFAVMVIDIDHFKSINDAYGHGAGDACLIHFSRVASARLRQTDLLARLGGDEFCLLLRETDGPSAERLGAELLHLIRTDAVEWYGAAIPLTLSIGIALWDPHRHADTLCLMEDADRALYLVKRQGRNGCALAQPEPGEAPALPRLALAP